MRIQIKNCRLSFASLRKPYVPKVGDPKFTFNGICSADTKIVVTAKDGSKKVLPHTAMDKVLDAVCKEKWGKTPAKLENYAYNRADTAVGSRQPRINEDGDFYDGYEADTMFFSAGVKQADKPQGVPIFDQKREPLPAESGHPINGDYVNAIINLFAYEYEGKKGISASIEGVQYLRKGEPFGSAGVDSKEFDEEELEDDDLDSDEEEGDPDSGIF